MKKLLYLLLAACIYFPVAAETALPAELDGSMSLYDFSAVEPRVIPDSLRPVGISYIARHGARYLTSENKILAVEKILNEARRRGSLTGKGKACLALMERIRTSTAGQWGMLSPIGKEQELRLGREMVRMFPEVFVKDGGGVKGESSYVPRVIETMDQFIIAIADTIDGIPTTASSGHAFDRLTRFFAVDPAYVGWRKQGDWKEAYEDYAARTLPVSPALELIGKKSGMDDKQLRQLTYDLYKVLQGLRAMGLPAPTTEWMTPEDYAACWHVTNLEKYFQYSLSPLSTIPAKGATDVLFRLIDEQIAIENGTAGPGLYGIFGHAETLLPIFSLLGVPTSTGLPLDYDSLYNEWSDARLTPLAANLAIIYSRAPSGAIYAAMRLNGRNISPVNDPERLMVPMQELRAYWLHRYLELAR
ncbi:MAG: histidine phosphatase family protein [Muribaculaceae bacterium]|nr:histidine phosphatase family protein [Muribaculaceae bacterium]